MKEINGKKYLRYAGILLATVICMVGLAAIVGFPVSWDGFAVVFSVLYSAFCIPFLLGLSKENNISKYLISIVAAAVLDVVFVLSVDTDIETLVVYLGILVSVSLAGVSLGCFVRFIIKKIIKKVKKSDVAPKKEEG